MDHPDIPSAQKKQGKAEDHQGLPAKPRGRPRKAAPGQTAGSDAPAVASFSIPARPEVEAQEKQDGRKFIVLPFRLYNDRTISKAALRVLVTLAAHANRNGFTWCGVQRIADELGITQQAVSVQMVALKELGYIEETSAHYYGGPTARTATVRIIYDASMTAEDVIARNSGRFVTNTEGMMGVEASLDVEVVKPVQDLTPAELTIVSRYRAEGLEPPTGARLAAEAAQIKA